MNSAFDFKREDFEKSILDFGLENTTAAVVDTVAEKNPGLFSYETLKQGTAPIFDTLPGFEDRPVKERRLNDEEILSLFTNVENPSVGKEFSSSLARGIAKGLPEVIVGALGYKLAEPLSLLISGTNPYAIAGRLAIKGLAGFTAAGMAGDLMEENILPEKSVIAPSLSKARMAGDTIGSALAYSQITKIDDLFKKMGVQEFKSVGAETFLRNFKKTASDKTAKEADEAISILEGATKGIKIPKTRFTDEKTLFNNKKVRRRDKDSVEYQTVEKLANEAGLSVRQYIKARKSGQQATETTEQRMDAVNKVRDVVGSVFGETGKDAFGKATPESAFEAGIKTSRLANFIQSLEKGVSGGLEFARKNPKEFYTGEVAYAGAAGAFAAGAGAAEPFDPNLRVLSETVSGGAVTATYQPAGKVFDLATNLIKSMKNKLGAGNQSMTKAEKEGTNRILIFFENSPAFQNAMDARVQEGASPQELKKIRDDLFESFFEALEKGRGFDAEEGKDVIFTSSEALYRSGMPEFAKTLNAATTAVEEGKSQISFAQSKARERLLQESIFAFETLRASGDPEALKLAAALQQKIFENGIQGEIDQKIGNQLAALNRLIKQKDNPNEEFLDSERIKISENLYGILKTQLQATRARERLLWKKTDQFILTEFLDTKGNVLEQPYTIKVLKDIEEKYKASGDEDGLGTFQAALGVNWGKGSKKVLEHFYRTDSDGNLTDVIKPLSELQATMQNSPWNSSVAQSRRSDILDQVDAIRTAKGSGRIARELEQIAEAMRRDTLGFSIEPDFFKIGQEGQIYKPDINNKDAIDAYTTARNYTFARNEVWDRSFIGDIFETKRKRGGAKLNPDALFNELFTGGLAGKHTQQRVEDILQAGAFGIEKNLDYSELTPKDIELFNNFTGTNLDPSNLTAEQMNLSLSSAMDTVVREALTLITRKGTNRDRIAYDRSRPEIDIDGEPTGVNVIPSVMVDENKLKAFKNSEFGKSVMAKFPSLIDDFRNVENAQRTLDVFSRTALSPEINRAARAINSVVTFSEMPSKAIELALTDKTNPEKALTSIIEGIDKLFEKNKTIFNEKTQESFTKEDVYAGFRNAIFDLARTKAVGGTPGLSGKELKIFFFDEQPYSKGSEKFKLIDWMEQNKLISNKKLKGSDKTYRENLNDVLEQMANVENAFYAGDVDSTLFKNPSPAQLYQAKMIGATLGARGQQQFNEFLGTVLGTQRNTLGGGMVAAEGGSELAQNILFGIPESKTIEALTEVLMDSNKLADFGRKTKEAGDKINKDFGDQRTFSSEAIRQRLPYLETYVSEEERQVLPPSPAPQLQQPVPTPTMAPASVAPPTASSSRPVDRSQYAALFPNDIASGIIRSQDQGIGSLMG